MKLPSVNPQTFEVFTIENLESIFPSNYKNRSKTNLSKTNTTNPQQWKNNDDLHRWISFGKSRTNRFRCSYQKEWPRKHINQNCTCRHKNGNHLSRRHQHFYRKPTYICRQSSSNTSHHRAKSQKLPLHDHHRNKTKPHKYQP